MEGFCTRSSSILQIVGYIILVIKIVVPLIIIIIGSVDFSKAVFSGDEKDIKSSALVLIKRLLIGIVVFLLPSIVRVIFYGVYDIRNDESAKEEAAVCINCITSPSGCKKSGNEIFK